MMGDFRWEHYGSSTFGEMVDLRNISQFAIILGVLLIVVGVVLYAVSVSKHNSKSSGSGHGGEWMSNVQPQPGTRAVLRKLRKASHRRRKILPLLRL